MMFLAVANWLTPPQRLFGWLQHWQPSYQYVAYLTLVLSSIPTMVYVCRYIYIMLTDRAGSTQHSCSSLPHSLQQVSNLNQSLQSLEYLVCLTTVSIVNLCFNCVKSRRDYTKPFLYNSSTCPIINGSISSSLAVQGLKYQSTDSELLSKLIMYFVI